MVQYSPQFVSERALFVLSVSVCRGGAKANVGEVETDICRQRRFPCDQFYLQKRLSLRFISNSTSTSIVVVLQTYRQAKWWRHPSTPPYGYTSFHLVERKVVFVCLCLHIDLWLGFSVVEFLSACLH